MQIIDNTSAPNDSALVPAVEHFGEPTSQPSYEIADEDKHHVDAILAIDAINDVAGPHEIPKGWNNLGSLKASALPKELQRKVEAKLANFPAERRGAMEAEFTAEAIRGMRGSLRVKTGLGEGATLYHREMLDITREYHDAETQFLRLQDELAEVARYDTQFDPITGQSTPVPVMRVSENRRRGILAEMESLNSRMALLHKDGKPGVEAEKRLKQAMYDSVMQRKELARQVEERAEARRRAAEINREARINEQAKRFASQVRHTF